MAHDLEQIRDSLRKFAEERDWDQFHSPRNLATALIVEAAELLEHFQWDIGSDSTRPSGKKLDEIQEELADIFIYLVRLADRLEVDLLHAAKRKIDKNASKYPVAKARGSSRKYTDL